MFSEKQRSWLTGTFSVNNYSSWKEWTDNQPYNYLWKSYKLLMWNINEDCSSSKFNIQLFYLMPKEKFEMQVVHIPVNQDDEEEIRLWLKDQIWVN